MPAADESHGPGTATAQAHSHDAGGRTTKTLALVSAINLVGFAAELAGGLLFGSVALLSDAVHMLFDALAYVMAFTAAAVAERSGTSGRYSYGLHRLEPLAAFLNGVLLIPMVAYVLYESYRRFLDPVAIDAGPTLALAVGGLMVNLVSVYVLRGGEMSLNERGAYYHLLGDAGGSVAVVVATLAVELAGLRVVDPLAAVVIAALILWSAGAILRGSGAIFLGAAPVDRATASDRLTDLENVTAVRDLHTWQICSRITLATAHVEADVDSLAAAQDVTDRVHRELAGVGVDHATVELHTPEFDRSDHLDAHGH